MGRGRQKAKQTKVARDLKYSSSSLDTLALQRELAGAPSVEPPVIEDEEDDEDPYASYAYDDDDEDDEPVNGSPRRH